VKLALKNITVVVSIVATGIVPVVLKAQSLLPAPDSTFANKSSFTNRLDLSRFSYAGNGAMNKAGTASSYNSFLKNIGSYKLNLSNGFSLKTQGISTVSALNPNNFRRENLLSREDLLYGQHFSFGASYNGLNNMLRGGFGGTNGRNPGLSLHAGISF
jgi:hypothetical protein